MRTRVRPDGEEAARQYTEAWCADGEIGYVELAGGGRVARRRYARVNVPVTLVYGDYDWSRPSDRQANLALFPAATSVALPETGHFAALERPADLARILLST